MEGTGWGRVEGGWFMKEGGGGGIKGYTYKESYELH